MKLAGAAASRYFARPEPDRTGLLIFGANAMRVALRRQEVVAALIGPKGADEMRLTRIAAADLRMDPALVADGLRALGFFPGRRAVLVEDAGDALADVLGAALADWQKGDAQLVVTAGKLGNGSALRRAFEAHANAYAIGIYDDPPSRDEVIAALKAARVTPPEGPAMADLMALAQALDPGDFRQFAEKLGLYKHGDPTPVGARDIAACAPATIEAELDDLLDLVAGRQPGAVAGMLRRIEAQGIGAVTLAIGAMRHFRALQSALADPGGPGAGLARLRPPVFGPRRGKMAAQAREWGPAPLDWAVQQLVEADLTLRSSSRAPAMAVIERVLIRLASAPKR